MPIRINLLAEAQELEEQRRRDPVKRVILVGVLLVGLLLVWSSFLMAKTMVMKADVNRLDGNLNSRTNEYRQVLENQKKLTEDLQKMQKLHELATNRFLLGNLLDSLKNIPVDNAQLLQLKVDQTYTVTADPKTAADKAAAKPATSTEKIVLTINAKDFSPNPGDAVTKLHSALSSSPFFQSAIGKGTGFRLTSLGSPQSDPEGKPFILFALEGRLPEKTR